MTLLIFLVFSFDLVYNSQTLPSIGSFYANKASAVEEDWFLMEDGGSSL